MESLILLGSRAKLRAEYQCSTAVSAGNICPFEKKDIEMRFLRSVSTRLRKCKAACGQSLELFALTFCECHSGNDLVKRTRQALCEFLH